MNRDGARKSIWQSEIATLSKQIIPEQLYDVAIIGAGITGASCAARLQASGKSCILIEANNMCFGTTGGTTAHLNTFFDASYDQVIKDFGIDNAVLLANVGKEAIHMIRHNIANHHISCDFSERVAYILAKDKAQVKMLENMVEASARVDIKMQWVEENPFSIPSLKTVSVAGQAQFHPVKYVKGLIEAFSRAGGVFTDECMVLNYSETNNTVMLETAKGIVRAKYVIYATHIPPGIHAMHFCNAPYRSYALACTLKSGIYPDALGYDMNDPYHYYRSQIIEGQPYLIAGGADHKTGHAEDTGVHFATLESHVRDLFDVDQVMFSWSSQYYVPADGLPFIGKMSGDSEHIYLATGYNGNGMIFGTIASRILTDMILFGHSEYAQLFDPSRIKPIAGFANFVKETADVAVHYIKDKLLVEKIDSLAELAENEAKVVKYEGDSYAVYKDHLGRAHIVKSACTHAKCNVLWNSAEKTWDCPCHGSRFNINGKVLTGPAVRNLPGN